MVDEIEKQKEIEQKLAANWQNLDTDYLWKFQPADNECSKLLIVMDEKKSTPHSCYPHTSAALVVPLSARLTPRFTH